MAKPREQHQYRNGTWSAGKPISMKRFATSAATMDFLLEQDRAAATEIGQGRDWNGRLRYTMDEAAQFDPVTMDLAGRQRNNRRSMAGVEKAGVVPAGNRQACMNPMVEDLLEKVAWK